MIIRVGILGNRSRLYGFTGIYSNRSKRKSYSSEFWYQDGENLLDIRRSKVKTALGTLITKKKGLGFSKVFRICALFFMNFSFEFKTLSKVESLKVERFIFDSYLTGRVVLQFMLSNLRRKLLNGSYVGKRIRFGLPSRGQRTRTNSKTANKFFEKKKYFMAIK